MFQTTTPLRAGLVIAAGAAVLTACGGDEQSQWEEIEEEGVLTVATSGTLAPTSFYSDESDELTGFEVELTREAADRLGLDVEFDEMGFDGMLTSINNGQVDLAVNDIDINEQREEQFLFTDPYKFSYGAMIVREDDYSGIESMEDLEGKRHGGAATTIYMEMAEDLGAEGVTYENVTNDVYLENVERGELDFVMNDYYLQSMAAEQLDHIDVTVHPELFYHPNNQAMILKDDSTELQENLNEVLAEMMEDGTITELSEQFFGGQDVSEEPDVDFVDVPDVDDPADDELDDA
ncbi:transporter substrate-binding domain-containing protein [Salisediminibacterium halotolerans]|uniref:transporter substrate-binding domain-containing protein n=1 Tax=Salisediminibacterium halotolerans TaxID=517425 RepID=UPI000EAF5369|nr:transporter substrate-binding domain-containing protein [Salisediminibacterium halotolerans]RLJ73247.1 amino acid ABC transporter substrate-binding protein (PAAT family) [Actinophytocola xinjiangensis]RPE86669.1 amino acid ABC transporter substrate-binding protein (PAAT family) [Salisediminibacterium halotolerans]TWG34044.1 amino acid ABC transporter substrate-binding protein (PAAT family) [Salisediminibacterium halotolerans]GEL08299.1 putative ABC transporter extracellular-binding protein Y